jgi:uncharacterized Zn-finger protein
MANEVIPHFHNDLGVQVIEIGAKKFMCMGALPPQDHHMFFAIWATTWSMCARIAQRFIGTTLRSRRTKRARRNVSSTSSSDFRCF